MNLRKILERNYFDSNPIKKTKNLKKIQHIAKLVKEKNYPKIEELAEKIFGKEFISYSGLMWNDIVNNCNNF